MAISEGDMIYYRDKQIHKKGLFFYVNATCPQDTAIGPRNVIRDDVYIICKGVNNLGLRRHHFV